MAPSISCRDLWQRWKIYQGKLEPRRGIDDFSPDVEGVVAIVGKKVLVREGVLADDAGDDDGGDGDADVVVPQELG